MTTIDELTGKIETLQDRIEWLESKPSNRRREKRLTRLRNRVLRLEDRVDSFELSAQLSTAKLPQDTFEIHLKGDGMEFNIHDSTSDDTFTGGDPLIMQIQATRAKSNGGTETMTERTTLANGQYWEGLSDQTIFAGGSVFSKLQNFDQFTVTVATDDGNRPMSFDQDDILAAQTFSPTDLLV